MDLPPPKLLSNLAMAAAATVLEARHPDAACAFVAGSIMREEGTTGSDIDLVVLYPRLERAWRESFHAEGFPFEVFVQDPSTLRHYLAQDVATGRPAMISMVAEGRIIGRDVARARHWQAEARSLRDAGPSPEPDRMLLYQVSDMVEDLRGLRPADEVRAIAIQLYPKLADLMLIGRGLWSGAGKWVPRRLRALGGELVLELDKAMTGAFDGDGAALLRLGQAELEGATAAPVSTVSARPGWNRGKAAFSPRPASLQTAAGVRRCRGQLQQSRRHDVTPSGAAAV